jgi:uncharacterized protein YgiM (DUF1202 family)
MSVIKNDYIALNPYSRPGLALPTVNKIIMHYTANKGGTAKNHRNYFNNLRDRYASAHIFVDDTEALCIVPLNEVAYQANDVQRYVNGSPYRGVPALLSNANFKAVGVEMCLDKKGNITAATFNRSVDVAVELCKKFKLSANDIVRHYDVTGKNCPAPWVKNPSEFTRFKNTVAAKLKAPAPLHGLHWRWARRTLYIRAGANWNSKVAFTVPNYYAVQFDYDVQKNGFIQIIFQGKKGWYKPSTTLYWFEKNPTVKYVVTGDIVNFRKKEKWGSKIAQTKKKDETVLVLRKMKNGWLQVVLTNGVIGYIPNSTKYVKKKM